MLPSPNRSIGNQAETVRSSLVRVLENRVTAIAKYSVKKKKDNFKTSGYLPGTGGGREGKPLHKGDSFSWVDGKILVMDSGDGLTLNAINATKLHS